MERIITCPKYMIAITGLDPLSLGELIWSIWKIRKMRYFYLTDGWSDLNEICI